METPASIRNHPIHPMLIPFPIGLWVFSLVADVVYLSVHDPLWHTMAYWTMIGGTIGALAAAVPGLLDYLSLREPRAVRIATIHLTLNLTIVALFIANLILRTLNYPPTAPFVLSCAGVAMLVVSGWFGWALIYGEGIGVHPTIEVRERERVRRGAA